MAGALLLLLGTVGLVDRLLPGGREAAWPGWAQPAAACALLLIGLPLYLLGGRWR
jgi:hypothetical protein